jgi:dolichol kinase
VTGHNERARQWVHAGSGAFALALRFLTWWQAALLAAIALVFNALVLPHVGGRRLYRPVDQARGFPLGILLYPLAVLMLILMFPSRLDIAAAAWAILALGDGAATLVGQAVRSSPLPWNRDKSVAGTAAFIGLGAIGGVALAGWTRTAIDPQPSMTFTILAPVVAAVMAASVETIPVQLDDNISVPATAAAVLWLASIGSAAVLHDALPSILATLPWALAVNIPVSYIGYRAKTVSLSGWIGGAVIGLVIYACLGGGAWLFLFATFLVASVTSRLGLKRKLLLGIAEGRGGRRGAGNAIANCGHRCGSGNRRGHDAASRGCLAGIRRRVDSRW